MKMRGSREKLDRTANKRCFMFAQMLNRFGDLKQIRLLMASVLAAISVLVGRRRFICMFRQCLRSFDEF